MSEACACWNCGHVNDALVNVIGAPRGPKDGDAALCFECDEFSVVDGPLVRKPTDLEMLSILADPRSKTIRAEAKAMRATFN